MYQNIGRRRKKMYGERFFFSVSEPEGPNVKNPIKQVVDDAIHWVSKQYEAVSDWFG